MSCYELIRSAYEVSLYVIASIVIVHRVRQFKLTIFVGTVNSALSVKELFLSSKGVVAYCDINYWLI